MPSQLTGPPVKDPKTKKDVLTPLKTKKYGEIEALQNMWTPPERNKYKPLPFYDICSELKTTLEKDHNLKVTATQIDTVPGGLGKNDAEFVEKYGPDQNYGREDMQMFTFFDVDYKDQDFKHIDMLNYRYGVLSSHDTTRGTWLVAGAQVGACTNGMVWGKEYTAKLNHFGAFDDIISEMKYMFATGVRYIFDRHKLMDKCIDGMTQAPVNDVQAHDIIMKSARAKAISPSNVLKIDDHWKMNSDEGKVFGDRNAWSLYNAFTDAYKSQRVTSAFDNNRKLNHVFEREFQLPMVA
jgi:hypothetical protein